MSNWTYRRYRLWTRFKSIQKRGKSERVWSVAEEKMEKFHRIAKGHGRRVEKKKFCLRSRATKRDSKNTFAPERKKRTVTAVLKAPEQDRLKSDKQRADGGSIQGRMATGGELLRMKARNGCPGLRTQWTKIGSRGKPGSLTLRNLRTIWGTPCRAD